MSPVTAMPETVTPDLVAPASALRSVLLAPLRPSTWTAALHLLASMPLGILWFTLITSLASIGLGTLITLVGAPILCLLGVLVMLCARFERWRAGVLLGARIADPHADFSGLPLGRRVLGRLAEAALWRDVLYLLLRLPVGILTFTAAVTLVTLPLGLILAPVLAPLSGAPMHVGFFVADTPLELAACAALGLLLVVPAAWAIRGLASLERLLAAALLGPSPSELKARVDQLSASRTRSVVAGEAERRRIERDLHDGAQQRLIRLAMDLGIALERMKTDPASAEGLVRQAHEDAKAAIAELRDLARGIHPAVLADRGLDAALSALAARCPVPVDVAVDVQPRPPAAVESAAYFLIAEALANVAKHARATKASVRAEKQGDVLRVEVGDNGAGGAGIVPGGGLAGLADRLAALDGRLWIESPQGGPTRVVAEIPCG